MSMCVSKRMSVSSAMEMLQPLPALQCRGHAERSEAIRSRGGPASYRVLVAKLFSSPIHARGTEQGSAIAYIDQALWDIKGSLLACPFISFWGLGSGQSACVWPCFGADSGRGPIMPERASRGLRRSDFGYSIVMTPTIIMTTRQRYINKSNTWRQSETLWRGRRSYFRDPWPIRSGLGPKVVGVGKTFRPFSWKTQCGMRILKR